MKPISDAVSAQDWQTLSQLRIAFGHQSVGANVIDGITALAKENSSPLAISETKAAFTAPGIHHFKIGRNEEPESKLRDFEATMTSGLADSTDIALMKLCYIDFKPGSDPKQIAQAYIAEVDKLSAQYPSTTFVPVTAPLTTIQTGPKALIKKLMGKSPAGYEGNSQRKVFNEELRSHYAANSRLFDLAAVESASGSIGVEHGGQRIEALDPALTDDGGHLNAQGQRRVGGALLHHLANLKR